MNFHSQIGTAGQRRRIAVIGSGISGTSAAWALSKTDDVTLFESEDRPGGHTCTVDFTHTGKQLSVDVGFIVFNERNYPNLCALFDLLDVNSEETNMSFAMSLDGGKREWCGESLSSVFAQKKNLFSVPFLMMLKDVLRFNRIAVADCTSGFTSGKSLGDYLAERKFSDRFRDDYLVPMAAAIWSTPEIDVLDFPASTFITFFDNHRLLEVSPPVWRTVSGGSRNYLKKMLASINDIRLGAKVQSISRQPNGSVIVTTAKTREEFDSVIIATHSDQALAMLADPSEQEKTLLSAVRYAPNRVVLHSDETLMPKSKKAWAAWNTLRVSGGADGPVSLTYWMNRLQHLDSKYPTFVTLNPAQEPDPAKTYGRWTFDHPQFDAAAVDAQQKLPAIQGLRNTWYAGAWTGYGFHEDGLKSGLRVAEALGATIPWRANPSFETAPLKVAAE